MVNIIKFLVMQENRKDTISIYFSIIIAYLEDRKWEEAQKTVAFLRSQRDKGILIFTKHDEMAFRHLHMLALLKFDRGVDWLTEALYGPKVDLKENLEEIAATQIDEDEEAQIRARTQEVEELLKNDIINLNSVSTH